MKHKKILFYFLHFIIYTYYTFILSPIQSLHSPNYIISNISNIFLQNYSSSISITTKEMLFSNETELFSKYSYFLATSKSGIVSIISNNNKTLFSLDFKKTMYDTNIDQMNIINEDKVVLALEGKLFIVQNNFEVQNFEEFTTPISELVDMTPFSLWFMPDYYFLSSKNYSIVKIVNNNDNKYNIDIDLNLIVFVDYTLICLKDKEQVWNTTITNAYFLSKNEENKIKNKKIKIEELMLIYENNEIFEKKVKNKFESDILFIHGYDKEKKRYIKIYDFNTYSHIVQNITVNNIEEQNSNNIIGALEYKSNISEKYDHIDLLIYYSIIAFIILWIIILVFHSFIFKILFSISKLLKYFNKFPEKKVTDKIITNNINNNKIQSNSLKRNNTVEQPQNEIYELMFQNIQNNFMENKNTNVNDTDSKERKKTEDIENKVSKLELDNIKNKNEKNEKDNEKEKGKLFKEIKKDINKHKIKYSLSNKNIKRFKTIKKLMNFNSFSNSNTDLNEASPKDKIKINNNNNNDNNYCLNTERKINNKYDDINLKKEKSSPSTSLTRLEKDFKDITLVSKSKIGNNIGVVLKAKHIIDEEIYAIKIKKLSNPNDEQIVINEAKNMTKIHSKHIVEYITCWFDKSLGRFEYLFGDDNDNSDIFNSMNEYDDINYSSSKINKKVFKEDQLVFKNQISQEYKKDDYYVKQLYEKSSLSDNEYINNKKKVIFKKKFYPKKNSNEENKNKSKYDNSKINNYIDDSLIKSNISISKKDIPNLNMYFFIQMEYCQGLTLSEYIKNHSKVGINSKTLYTFTYQIIKSLSRIHENKIVHRDINPDNIFIDNENSIKIGDFSSAKEIQSSKFKKKFNRNSKMQLSLSTGKLNKEDIDPSEEKDFDLDKENWESSIYWSPEQEKGWPANKKSDIYSVGLVLYVMCECLGSEKDRKKSIIELKKKNIISDKVKNLYNLQYKLILKMIENEPDNRPNCEKLLNSDEMKKWKKMAEE